MQPPATNRRRPPRSAAALWIGVVVIAAGAFALVLICVFARPLGAAAVGAWVRRQFPEVPAVSTRELAAWLADDAARRPRPLLLDVREPAEYAVSHLPGARLFSPGSPPAALPAGLPKDAPIVTYCSVGYRSALLARRLRAAGYSNVRNLSGSIFRWANENRPLVDADGHPTPLVHPYNALWGKLVDRRHRARVPPPT